MDLQKARAKALVELGATSVSVSDDLSYAVEPNDLDVSTLSAVEHRIGLDMAKAGAKAEMLGWIEEFTQQFTREYAGAEVSAWSRKAEAARAHTLEAPQAIIVQEASVTEETPEALAQTIIAKADLFEGVVARVTGLRRKTVWAIDAAETAEALPGILSDAQTAALALAAELGIT